MFDSHIAYCNHIQSNDPIFQVACEPEYKTLRAQTAVSQPIRRHFMSICRAGNQFSRADLQNISTSHNMKPEDQIVSFYPVDKKGSNYLKYCTGWLSDNQKPSNITNCIRRYTSDPDWFCTEVNLALAADSANLRKYGPYIKQLKYSIGMSRMNFTGTVFRGVNMSPAEIASYERDSLFFIPSFTSTSRTKPFEEKNTLIHIDITPEWSKFCMEIQPRHTKFSHENEILFSCYNLYRYERTERMNHQRIIKLSLMNYTKHFDYRTNTIID